jgi:hypothetical protein
MPVVRIDLSESAFERLAHLAVRERRPIPMQAEHLIERAVRRVNTSPRPPASPRVTADAASHEEACANGSR